MFDDISSYTLIGVALFTAKQHQRGRSWGFAQVYRSPDRLGLVSLNGIVVAPRPNRSGGLRPTPPGKDVGEPGAGRTAWPVRWEGAGKEPAMPADHGGPRETKRHEPGITYSRSPRKLPTRPYSPMKALGIE
jgi:hypothetical protein